MMTEWPSRFTVRRVSTAVIGNLYLIAHDTALVAIEWEDSARHASEARESHSILGLAEEQIKAFLSGRLRNFSIPIAPQGTPFQKKVWSALLAIPYGQTTSYGDIAQRISHPTAVRAVGGAIGKNPLPIVIPCHRVIGKHGRLTGFSGGLDRKRALLQREGLSS
jgi:methylated-DNA-[protein]-cysteine S-methyltransferase